METSTTVVGVSSGASTLNGTEDLDLEWSAVDWRHHEDEVRRLRRRIFKASQQGDLKKVRNLQKLMLRSYSNTLVSVRRVTQQNAGRSTAGIDGQVVTTSRGRAELAVSIHSQSEPWKAKPVKRVYIPKSNGKQHPLGIPVLRDRVIQARVKNALEPEWEAKFEARSYGFRPGRSTQDAVQCLFKVLHSAKRIRGWVLEADLEGAFDHIGIDDEPQSPREWQQWFDASDKAVHVHHHVYRSDGGSDDLSNLRLVHQHCHRQHHAL